MTTRFLLAAGAISVAFWVMCRGVDEPGASRVMVLVGAIGVGFYLASAWWFLTWASAWYWGIG